MKDEISKELVFKHDREMQSVYRFSGCPLVGSQNLAAHGCLVGIWFLEITKNLPIEPTAKDMLFVLRHDIVETVTGDLLYPAKNHNPKVAEMWEDIEETIVGDNYHCLIPYLESVAKPQFSDPLLWKAFRCADAVEGLMFCRDELAKGNSSTHLLEANDKYSLVLRDYYSEFPFLEELINNYGN